MANADKQHQRELIRLFGRITLYYIILCGVGALIYKVNPGLAVNFPVGGLQYYSTVQDAPVSEIGEILREADSTRIPFEAQTWGMRIQSLFIAMLATFLLMIPVSWVFKTIHQGDDFDHSIDETALILPAVVAGIVTVVQHSLALAFSLAGIMAGVRFRRALSDTFDTLFIFVAIGVGLAAGVASIETAIAITVFFNYATILICIFGDGLESKYIKQKKAARQDEKLQRQIKLQQSADNEGK